MPYDPTVWVDDTTPLSADNLNNMEQGIDDAHTALENLSADAADIVVDPAVGGEANVQDVLETHETRLDAAEAAIVASTASMILPVHLSTPASSVTAIAGNAFWTAVALTDWDAGHWEFLKDVKGKLYGMIRVPAGISTTGGSLFLEISANATSGVTRLLVGHKAIADGETMNATLTDITAQDITVPGTAYFRKTVTFAVTESLVAGDILVVEVYHEGDHANDTLNANTILWGAWLSVPIVT